MTKLLFLDLAEIIGSLLPTFPENTYIDSGEDLRICNRSTEMVNPVQTQDLTERNDVKEDRSEYINNSNPSPLKRLETTKFTTQKFISMTSASRVGYIVYDEEKCKLIVEKYKQDSLRLPLLLMNNERRRERKYSYRRRGEIVLDMTFDSSSKRLVMRKYLTNILPFSDSWLSDTH